MRKKLFTYRFFISLLLGFGAFSCEDFVKVDLPSSQVSSELVFENDETAIAAAAGMYNTLLYANSFIGEFHPISALGGLSSDELVDYTGTAPFTEFYDNQLGINNSAVLDVWSSAFKTIYEANAIIEGITSSSSMSLNIRKQLEGEAKFVRAFCNFYLVNLFGDIPLVVSTDYRKNATITRTSSLKIYEQIVSDLLEAKDLLTIDYFGDNKIRPNMWSATALLARVYLYQKNYAKAESEVSEILSSSTYELVADLSKVFLKNNSESILELSQVYPNGHPTADASYFVLAGYYIKTELRNDFLDSFDNDDLRKSKWTRTFDGVNIFPGKYRVNVVFNQPDYPENLVLLRLAEQYLIRAEARAELDDIAGAQSDLNAIRKRAGLPDTEASDKAALKLAIEQERKFELFCEMGHRWLDLKRTDRADAILGPLKTSWNSTDIYYPIPENEMLNNPKLTPQNDGY